MFFLSSVRGGRENYFRELGDLLRSTDGHPEPAQVRDLGSKYGTEQITGMHG